jgi:hypothetical protein
MVSKDRGGQNFALRLYPILFNSHPKIWCMVKEVTAICQTKKRGVQKKLCTPFKRDL